MIQTKVASILSPRQVILAAGSDQGVREGMEFVIYELGHDISDPETGESLGTLELIKGRVRVSHVQEKLSHATTFSRSVTETINPMGEVASLARLFQPRQITRTVYDELKVEGAVGVQTDLTVRVGDLARSVERQPVDLSN